MAEGTSESSPRLSALFDTLWKDYEFLESSSEPSNSSAIQSRVQQAIKNGEKAVHMVNDLSLFSTNENLEEVATNEIRYLLLPGLLGYFMNRSMKDSRFETVKKSQIYFIDFLRLCKLYGVTNIELPKPYKPTDESDESSSPPPKTGSGTASVEEQMKKRHMKIERFKSQKEIEKNLNELYDLVKKESVDDETKRNYYFTLLKKWINCAIENCESIEAEIPLLEHMMKTKDGKESHQTQKDNLKGNSKGVFRPFIITKDALQKQVFGLGYPGVPTFTVDEFYQHRVDEGIFPAAGSVPQSQSDPDQEQREREKSAREKEEKEEQDDEESIRKARQWDDWKDDNRRGWGNTKNKG